MKRWTLGSVAAIAVLVAVPDASARGFSLGVAAGEITSTSAQLWAHAGRAGRVGLQVSRSLRFGRGTIAIVAVASRTADDTVQVRVGRLRPGTRYVYRWTQGRARSRVGRFTTAPSPRRARTIRFAWSGDADAQPARGRSTPFYDSVGDRRFAVYRAMARERNAFNVNLGDTIYSDSEVGGRSSDSVLGALNPDSFPTALTRRAKWAKYRQNLRLDNLANLRGAAGLYSHPDDHEWVNDYGPREDLLAKDGTGRTIRVNGRRAYRPGVQAFLDYAPAHWSKRYGYFRVFHWGRNLDVFFLDERSFRSAKTGSPTIHTCDNPMTGTPDLAPAAPPEKRALFSSLIPSLAAPVAPACLAAINDPRRTFLGATQERAFFRAVKGSKATFKVIMNEVPIQRLYAGPYDQWEGYEADRERVLGFLQRNVKNVVFLTTDHHANLANTVYLKTFRSEGGPVNTGILDVATGPVATMTAKRELNQATGQDPATGTVAPAADSVFFTPKPDDGLGMLCSALDVFSYGEVTVSSRRLSIRLKDQNGHPVREEEGARPACPTITLNRR